MTDDEVKRLIPQRYRMAMDVIELILMIGLIVLLIYAFKNIYYLTHDPCAICTNKTGAMCVRMVMP